MNAAVGVAAPLSAMVTPVGSARPDGGRGVPSGRLITADRIVTLGRGRYRARAMLVRGSRVAWVGNDPDQAPPHAEHVDLGGCTIGPAFVDSHVHLTPTGLALLGLDLRTVQSTSELLRAVALHAEHHTGRVIWGHGWDSHGWDGPLPTPAELTAASGGRPVTLARIDGHSSLVDETTMQSAPLSRAGGIERDSDGVATGLLRRDANKVAKRWAIGAMGERELGDARAEVARHAAANGIGTVHEMGGPDAMGAADFDAWRTGEWPIEVLAYWGAPDLGFAAERDLRCIGGDIWLDGSLGSHTAALTTPYVDHPTRGALEYDDDTLTELFLDATRSEFQVAVHTIGDEAIDQALRCWRRVQQQLPEYEHGGLRRFRHRLEHAEVMRPDQYDEVADLGLVVSAQPVFEQLWGAPGGMYESRLGPERAALTNPYRALADRGVPLCFGSDANVTPIDPWSIVAAAQHRDDPAHELTRLEAVSASTLGGRHAGRQERWVGVLRAGMRADLSVWEGDPYAASDTGDPRCMLTMVRGRITHDAR
ncbi:MAG TPA: amidohydrolase [Nitriliruptoraceae bacterium]|nr:amidohydrolase [Nitriliruptoraceae bacterium]